MVELSIKAGGSKPDFAKIFHGPFESRQRLTPNQYLNASMSTVVNINKCLSCITGVSGDQSDFCGCGQCFPRYCSSRKSLRFLR